MSAATEDVLTEIDPEFAVWTVVEDVPKTLIAGRELEYLKWFHNSEAVNSCAFTDEGEETYARVYATPALRAGFDATGPFPTTLKPIRDEMPNCPPKGSNT